MPNAQAIVNAIQLQRNVALDNCATLSAELEEAKSTIKELQATVEDMKKLTNMDKPA